MRALTVAELDFVSGGEEGKDTLVVPGRRGPDYGNVSVITPEDLMLSGHLDIASALFGPGWQVVEQRKQFVPTKEQRKAIEDALRNAGIDPDSLPKESGNYYGLQYTDQSGNSWWIGGSESGGVAGGIKIPLP